MSRKERKNAYSGRGGLKHRVRVVAGLVLINVLILLLADWTLVKLHLLRPPIPPGDPTVGFFGDRPLNTSRDFGVVPAFPESLGVTIAMVGDSHSELGPKDRALYRHQFVFESCLRDAGVPAVVVAAGRGRYAPLQEYLLYTSRIREEYAPKVVVMNFYTGNDFYDMLRPDDRPHFRRRKDGTIEIRRPIWITFADPKGGSWGEERRLIWVSERLIGMVGYPRLFTRLRALSITTKGMGGNLLDLISYLREVNRSIEPRLGYYAAFSAQILNQALFFRDFPKGREEALTYLETLIKMAPSENPDVTFVMAPIPSAVLADAMPPDVETYWRETLARVGLTEEYVWELEHDMYETLRDLATKNGWIFVDLLNAFEKETTEEPLYNSVDLHVTESACQIIGRQEAEALLRERVVDHVTYGQ